jgi:hypothetical protein
VGKFTALCNRGWFLYGHPGVDGEPMTTITLSQELAAEKWLQLGRMVYVPHPKLPAWSGVIDPPWNAISPIEVAVYNAEYLFSLRSPERSVRYQGTIPFMLSQIINTINQQEQTYLLLGNVTGDNVAFDEPLNRQTFWDQIIPILQRSGYEMVIRPVRGDGKQLNIFVDVGKNLGQDTGFRLHDSAQGANMKVLDAKVDGIAANRVVGVSGQSAAESMLETDVLQDEDSQALYRTRSRTAQFRSVTKLSVLTDYTQNYLDASAKAYIDLTVEVYDKEDTFLMLRPGNRLVLHSSKVFLPGGVRGWKGIVRVVTMVYDEQDNTVKAKVRGYL